MSKIFYSFTFSVESRLSVRPYEADNTSQQWQLIEGCLQHRQQSSWVLGQQGRQIKADHDKDKPHQRWNQVFFDPANVKKKAVSSVTF